MSGLLSRKIRAARQAVSMTQQELAKRLGVTRGAVTQWESRENETRTSPSTDLLRSMAEVLEVPLDWLLNDDRGVDQVHSAQSHYRRNKHDHQSVVIETSPASPDNLSKMFWSAVMYEVYRQRPELQDCFETPIALGPTQLRADFLWADVAIEFARVTDPDNISMRQLGQLLLIEKAASRPLRKHLVLWAQHPQDKHDRLSIADIQVHFVSEPQEAAAIILHATNA